MVLFATHTDRSDKVQGIREPFILVGQVGNQGKDDGFFTLSEVLGLKLQTDLVVLTACQTGRGTVMAGGGVLPTSPGPSSMPGPAAF